VAADHDGVVTSGCGTRSIDANAAGEGRRPRAEEPVMHVMGMGRREINPTA
jgi:hypothetical protein